MTATNSAVEMLIANSNTFFILLGAIMVFAMHAGFAFLEVGTVRSKNQVNALVKIMTDFAISALVYFFIGYQIAYGINFFESAATLAEQSGYALVKFFFLMTFAAAIPAIISGGVAERARFYPMLISAAVIVGVAYPFLEGLIWNGNYGFQDWLETQFGAPFHDFAGSIVVHGFGGWVALAAIILLGTRNGRFRGDKLVAFAPSNIPFLALGAWILCIGWFGFNVMSAQTLDGISGLVAVNSLMAMVGGIIAAMILGKNDPGFIHNGPLAGLVAVCAGSDIMHPIGALATGLVAGALFTWLFTLIQQKFQHIDDVLGVWPLHGICGAWGGIAAGIFGLESLGGLGNVSFLSQLVGSAIGISIALVSGFVVYGTVKAVSGLRLSEEEEYNGADLSIHKIGSVSKD
ncbi:ammonium transporter [Marinomonas mediterranea]|uniref:Ammonium transporter n=1 Tax=Marinomonas mediterranea (strain ATCC 700492 / JCM 21426 / NBRC 103028 / MMB-1) TaxID=717774 RepID=F2JZ83_MARM1|nr:ammonium transporter [Marinomonas mediterranea]ADZ93168.1 ammonium transporter [Marinomonas mediterranea MMB-1]WCN11069.1 ammonium transporter [Marinomonas mediterranea]WCN15129.1 ammonium transporter [Marinomonas mediterranea]WCN19172.1 ammonium transporter [Marinomonas mediterranea MMB-1]